MNILITGSLGHISKSLAKTLLSDGHELTIITSKATRKGEIETIGARAAVGSLEDAAFLESTFKGADAVYTMIPPNNYFDHSLDLGAYYERLARNFAQAAIAAGLKRLVHLSSIGAHLEKGNGILAGPFVVEKILSQLENTAVTFLRPTSFFYNLEGYIYGIKADGAIRANYGTANVIPWVSPLDIAAAAAEELATSPGKGIRYVASEELMGNETASILGKAIGHRALTWELISDEAALDQLTRIGMNPEIAKGLVEMYAALQSGLLAEDYQQNKPKQLGKVKLADYAVEFARAFHETGGDGAN